MTRRSAASGIGRAVGLAAIGLLQTYWFLQPDPLVAKVLAAMLLAVSVASPAVGLLAFAALAPVSTTIAILCGGGTGFGAQLLESIALSIGAGVLLRDERAETPTRIGAPALLMAVVALASAVATIPAEAAPLARGLADGLLLKQLALRSAAQLFPVWSPLLAAIAIAACGLLGWATERTVRRTPELAMRLITLSLIGHAAAAALTFQAVLASAMRAGGWGNGLEALQQLLLSVRYSSQIDVHAAASSLVLATVAGLALLIGRGRLARVGVGLLVALIAIGMWISGSRVAMVVGVVATLATCGWLVARTSRRWRFAVIGVAVLALVAGSGLALYLRAPTARSGTVSNSVNARVLLAKAGLRMFEEQPLFGIGIAKFYAASPRFLDGRLGDTYRENAHNNFIQVLAEQGVVGLGALVWWLAVVILGGVRAQLASPTATRGCLLAAVAACVGTWMTGHPLLVPEFALVFWLYCGILSAMSPTPPVTRSRWLLWVAVGAVVLSVVPRAFALRNSVELEHRGFELSVWQDDDAQRYRAAHGSFALFLPATGRPVEVPLRRVGQAPDPLLIDVTISGQLLGTAELAGDSWFTLPVVVPSGSRRFELVEFALRLPAALPAEAGVLVRVGKTVAR